MEFARFSSYRFEEENICNFPFGRKKARLRVLNRTAREARSRAFFSTKWKITNVFFFKLIADPGAAFSHLLYRIRFSQKASLTFAALPIGTLSGYSMSS